MRSGHSLFCLSIYSRYSILQADYEGPNQTARMRKLNWGFAVCICHKAFVSWYVVYFKGIIFSFNRQRFSHYFLITNNVNNILSWQILSGRYYYFMPAWKTKLCEVKAKRKVHSVQVSVQSALGLVHLSRLWYTAYVWYTAQILGTLPRFYTSLYYWTF